MNVWLTPWWALRWALTFSPIPQEPVDPSTADQSKQEAQSDLQKEVERLRKLQESQAEQIRRLQQSLGASGKQSLEVELDAALEDSTPKSPAEPGSGLWSRRFGGTNFQLLDVSLDVLAAAGTSTATTEEIENLQGGGHDPKRRGFTLQQAELALQGAVDPYFDLETHLIYALEPEDGETILELEEAFATTRRLPSGLQLELGQSFTEFGRINPQHPHQWDFVDQPVIVSRLFGEDGTRGLGFRLGWLMPTPFYSELHVGMQNADQEQMVSFLGSGHGHGEEEEEDLPFEEGLGGRPLVERDEHDLADFLYLARWVGSFDHSASTTSTLGASFLYGPNATGEDGHTLVYGADLMVRWKPDGSGQALVFQGEVIKREWYADHFSDTFDPSDPTDDLSLDDDRLFDWGTYAQLIWHLNREYSFGLRQEYAAGDGDGFALARDEDPQRDDRWRSAFLATWSPSEFTRIRAQYNYDVADHLDDQDAHSVWLGFEFLIGSHPAHRY